MINAKTIEELREDGAYLLWFEDAEMQPILFSGAGARDAAIRAYEARSLAWNCVLFVDHKALATASLAREGEDGELCGKLEVWASHIAGDGPTLPALLRKAAARIRTLSAQLAEAEKYNGWHQEALLVRDAALERAEKAEGERDNARAECYWLTKRLLHERPLLSSIAQDVEDEGGRVYFGRTNDADALKDFVDEIENYDFDRITRESKWPDYIETSRLAHERAAAAERERDELRAEVERLREALDGLSYPDNHLRGPIMDGPELSASRAVFKSILKARWKRCPMERDKTCETCAWRGRLYKPADQDITFGGLAYMCRRHAPVVTGGLHAPTMTVWPWVQITDWCGEHTPKVPHA